MAKKTESNVNTRVKMGNLSLSHLSSSMPPNTPPTMMAAIWTAIPEYFA
ncbi:MAG: hypothetical protein JWP12_534 [Bacteroidetes bacterium]|nr:hypothetical protein [Bacteroidota bacterium]